MQVLRHVSISRSPKAQWSCATLSHANRVTSDVIAQRFSLRVFRLDAIAKVSFCFLSNKMPCVETRDHLFLFKAAIPSVFCALVVLSLF